MQNTSQIPIFGVNLKPLNLGMSLICDWLPCACRPTLDHGSYSTYSHLNRLNSAVHERHDGKQYGEHRQSMMWQPTYLGDAPASITNTSTSTSATTSTNVYDFFLAICGVVRAGLVCVCGGGGGRISAVLYLHYQPLLFRRRSSLVARSFRVVG